MLDASSAGRGQPKFKTINVEANLLAERAAERSQLRQAIRQRGVALVLLTVLGGIACPPLYAWQQKQAVKAAAAAATARTVAAQLSDLRRVQESAAPAMKDSEMRRKAASNAAHYFGRIMEFLDCAKPGVSLATVQGALTNGELKLTLRGEAVDFAHYLRYIENLQKAVGKDSVLPKSTLEGGSGLPVTFEVIYITKVTGQ